MNTPQRPKVPAGFGAALRVQFPTLQQQVNGRRLVYLDSAATAQKPQCVIDTISSFYHEDNANIHRAVYELGERATQRYENAREIVAKFINARESKEIIFVRGATEGINVIASTLGRKNITAGDEVLVTHLEHHANIVPWQLLCESVGATLKVVPVNDRGDLALDQLERLVTDQTKLIAFTHISNAIGTVNDAQAICDFARQRGIPTLVDGAQSAAHGPIDVQALGCDFFVFSGHKLYGPTGIGVLYGRAELLRTLPPYQGGGDMIDKVSFSGTTFADIPSRFEAGTPNIAGAVGLGAALQFMSTLDLNQLKQYEAELVEYGAQRLSEIPELTLVGSPEDRASVLSFVIEGTHPHDVGTLLSEFGVAVRVGHHCAQPILERFGVPATTRASVAAYTDPEDIDILVDALKRVVKMLR